MNTKDMIKDLTLWLKELKAMATIDDSSSIYWFPGTKTEKLSIIGGWQPGFNVAWNDLFYISKSEPEYAMCIKIAVNEGPYAYTDFEIMNMPVTEDGEVDDTLFALEHGDDLEMLATWLAGEWERMIKDYSSN